MRHRRDTLTPAHIRRLRVTAVMPCVAAMLVAALTGAAPAPGSPSGGHRASAVAHEHADPAVKSPDDHGTSPVGPPPPASSRTDEGGPRDYGAAGDAAGDGPGLFGTQDLHEPGPGTGYGSAPSSQHPPTTAATRHVSPVLPLGAGMTLIGLGLALIALRLRRA
ncbi:hypothetical protein [Streptomyces sp. WMMB 322]|uniref:hypothetical protein n=1 Tax=Streptomyces sp. WMMB 322 TaxID=1286821 RepID=UPI000823EA27|nr:hypothetical protein [Streptomyces sp. WMMB 322]SCK16246.1 hypothetical protein H180DRAFT_01096 [Streptomyces sp. WMMB 322]